jgi:chromosome segregation ATPase
MSNKYDAPCRGSESLNHCAEHMQSIFKCSEEKDALLRLSHAATEASQKAHGDDLLKVSKMLVDKAVPAHNAKVREMAALRLINADLEVKLSDHKAAVGELEDEKDDVHIDLCEQNRSLQRIVEQQNTELAEDAKLIEEATAALNSVSDALDKANEQAAELMAFIVTNELLDKMSKEEQSKDPMDVELPDRGFASEVEDALQSDQPPPPDPEQDPRPEPPAIDGEGPI